MGWGYSRFNRRGPPFYFTGITAVPAARLPLAARLPPAATCAAPPACPRAHLPRAAPARAGHVQRLLEGFFTAS
jgi:hypothetical protein